MTDPQRASNPFADRAPSELTYSARLRDAELHSSIEIEADLAETRRFTRRVVFVGVLLGTVIYGLFN